MTVPPIPESSPVTISKSSHPLTFVESIATISSGPIVGRQIVDAYELSNGELTIKVILQGGNIVSVVDKAGKEYVWLNKEGAANYGAGSDAFPLDRGLILHGGIRLSAVTAEHGLYYDSDWDIAFETGADEASIILSIQDTAENRALLCDPLSKAQYCAPGNPEPMSKYPVTDAIFTLKVTLRVGEAFLRLDCSVKNTKDVPVIAEAWLPQTYPITDKSQIISHQKKRRCKDLWVYMAMLKDNFVVKDMGFDEDRALKKYKGKNGFIVPCPATPANWNNVDLNVPLQWPSGGGGILYDYPARDGDYHAVSYGDGRGVAYVSVSTDINPHYTKMWSWGNPALFNRDEQLKLNPPLAAGRPKAEYYEPWGSAFNTGFFETYAFPPLTTSAWKCCIVPIASGLEKDKPHEELVQAVDVNAHVQAAVASLKV